MEIEMNDQSLEELKEVVEKAENLLNAVEVEIEDKAAELVKLKVEADYYQSTILFFEQLRTDKEE